MTRRIAVARFVATWARLAVKPSGQTFVATSLQAVFLQPGQGDVTIPRSFNCRAIRDLEDGKGRGGGGGGLRLNWLSSVMALNCSTDVPVACADQ